MTAWPWPSSDVTDKVIPAFVVALQGVEDVVKSKRVDAGAMRYSYADLDAVLEAAKPHLAAEGLAVTQAATGDGVHAVIMHNTGQWLSFPALHVQTQQTTPQAQGSAITYARRYQMLALLGIATEDDDGQTAGKPTRTRTRPAAPTEGPIGDHPPRDRHIPRQAPLSGDKPSPAQLRMAGALFNGKGWTGDERHTKTAELVGRPVESWNDLTKTEMTNMLDTLKAGSDEDR